MCPARINKTVAADRIDCETCVEFVAQAQLDQVLVGGTGQLLAALSSTRAGMALLVSQTPVVGAILQALSPAAMGEPFQGSPASDAAARCAMLACL